MNGLGPFRMVAGHDGAMVLRRVVVLVAGVALVCSACGAASPSAGSSRSEDPSGTTALAPGPTSTVPDSPAPSSVAPAAVGVTSATIVDPTRGTAARGERPAISRRELALTIRYPIAGAVGDEERPDAEPLGRFPLVVFAHGFDVSAGRYASLLHRIAAAGFVVVAPDFPMTSDIYGGAPLESDLPQQSLDIDAVIDQLQGELRPESTVGAIVRGAIAPGPVGVIGHSDGAVTVLLSAYSPRYRDRRIGAVVAVAGEASDFGGRWFDAAPAPLLALQAAEDEISPFARSVDLVAAHPGSATLVAIDGVTHLGAVTDPAVVPAVAALISDDLAAQLSRSVDASARVLVRRDGGPLRLVSSHGD